MSSSSFEWENRASRQRLSVLRRSPRERKRKSSLYRQSEAAERQERRRRRKPKKQQARRGRRTRVERADFGPRLAGCSGERTNNKTWQIGWNYLRTRRSSVGAVQTHACGSMLVVSLRMHVTTAVCLCAGRAFPRDTQQVFACRKMGPLPCTRDRLWQVPLYPSASSCCFRGPSRLVEAGRLQPRQAQRKAYVWTPATISTAEGELWRFVTRRRD